MLRRTSLNCLRLTFRTLLAAEALARATAARERVQQLWTQQEQAPTAFQATRHAKIAELMSEAKLDLSTPREDDVTLAMGESFERLMLLLVPLSPETTPVLEQVLQLANRNGIDVSIRTIQHMFSRAKNYAEAVTLFHTMRKCHVRMNMHAYYSMVFCLQRLEEESWCARFAEDVRGGKLTDDAMRFIVSGCDNQLLPEKKPWIGRVMFADADDAASTKDARDYDALGMAFAERFRRNVVIPKSSNTSAKSARRGKGRKQ